jgi:hypothetical protein
MPEGSTVCEGSFSYVQVSDNTFSLSLSVRALEVWGSRENLLKELLIRDAKRKAYQQSECFVVYLL